MDEVLNVFEEYGADPGVLEAYDCVPLRARIVRDAVKLRTASGSIALTKSHLSQDRLEYVHQCLEFASRRGLPKVPRFIRSRYGDAYVNHPSGLYFVTAWVSGRESDFRKQAEFIQGVRVLAGWHRTMMGFRPQNVAHPNLPGFRERIEAALHDFHDAWRTATQTTTPSPFQRLLVACADELKERCAAANTVFATAHTNEAETAARAGGCICHGNFHRQHVRLEGDVWVVLHYDGVHAGLQITDFGLLCHRYMPAFEWDVDVFLDAVTAYAEIVGYDATAVASLDAILAIPLRTLQVVSWYHRNAKDWDEEDFVDYLEACLALEEAREEARAALQRGAGGLVTVANGIADAPAQVSTGALPDLGSDWTVATFHLPTEAAPVPPPAPDVDMEGGSDEEGGLEVFVADLDDPVPQPESAAPTERASSNLKSSVSAAVKSPAAVVPGKPRQPLSRAVARRRRQRSGKRFKPEQPGLRLWHTDKHGGEHDEEQ